jgi:hypothetical protein
LFEKGFSILLPFFFGNKTVYYVNVISQYEAVYGTWSHEESTFEVIELNEIKS